MNKQKQMFRFIFYPEYFYSIPFWLLIKRIKFTSYIFFPPSNSHHMDERLTAAFILLLNYKKTKNSFQNSQNLLLISKFLI